MKKLYFLISFFCLAVDSQSCDEALLIVGGHGYSGPLGGQDSMHLLTPNNGWCNEIDFPKLDEPITRPAVHSFTLTKTGQNILIVCGFKTEYKCKWTESGSDKWNVLSVHGSTSQNNENFQIVELDDESLLMVSHKGSDDYKGNTHITSINWINPSFYPNPWTLAEDETGEFTMYGINPSHGWSSKNMSGSCLAKNGEEMLLTGGRTSQFNDWNDVMFYSDTTLWRMSRKDASPKWEQMRSNSGWQVLNQRREDHACLGTNFKGAEVVLVAGGNNYEYRSGKSGAADRYTRESFATLNSVEIYQDQVWIAGPELITGRMGFGLTNFCGEILAFGGRSYDGRYQMDAFYDWDCECYLETVDDTTAEYFMFDMEILESVGFNTEWQTYDTRLPQPMADFGVTKVPLSVCKS